MCPRTTALYPVAAPRLLWENQAVFFSLYSFTINQLCRQGPGSLNRQVPLHPGIVFVGRHLKHLVSDWPHVQGHAGGNHSQPDRASAIYPNQFEVERPYRSASTRLVPNSNIVRAQCYSLCIAQPLRKMLVFTSSIANTPSRMLVVEKSTRGIPGVTFFGPNLRSAATTNLIFSEEWQIFSEDFLYRQVYRYISEKL